MTRYTGGALVLSVVMGVLGTSGGARAQTTPNALDGTNNGDGFDTHLFRPAMDSKGFFSVNGSEVLSAKDVSFGLIIDYGRTLLRTADLSNLGQKSPQLINHSFQGTAQFSYGLFNRLIVGLDIPINLMAGDEQVTRATPPAALFPGQWGLNQVDSQTFGFIALHSKFRITRIDDGIGLAIGLHLGVPVSDAAKNGGADPSVWYWPQVIAEKRFGSRDQFRIGANAGYRGHSASGTKLTLKDGNFVDGSRVTYGLGASYRVIEPLDLVAETYGTYLLGDSSSAVAMSNEVIGGIKLFVERNSYLTIGAGPRYTAGFEAADFRAVIGFVFEPSIGDRDGDGIKDDVDQCPDEPEDKDHFKDEDGCPDPDNDNDGILDVDDRCPNEPETRNGFQDDDGCPDTVDGDRDGDGVPDSKDACPDVPGIKTNNPKTNGCPPPPPPPPDRDRDGIPDSQDACPDVPGVPNPDPKKNGCPPEDPNIKIDNNTLTTFEPIQFASASSTILPQSFKILDAVADTLKNHPEFVMIEVAGHADERGPEGYNLALTQSRVNSVMAALVQRHVDQQRLRSKGYGLYCPLDPAHNEAAWQQNRRVEFKILKTKEGPTGVELGCKSAESHGVKSDPVP